MNEFFRWVFFLSMCGFVITYSHKVVFEHQVEICIDPD